MGTKHADFFWHFEFRKGYQAFDNNNFKQYLANVLWKVVHGFFILSIKMIIQEEIFQDAEEYQLLFWGFKSRMNGFICFL